MRFDAATCKRVYDAFFYGYCLLSLGDLAFMLYLTAVSCEADYAAVNVWDAAYHGHNVGAHICTFVTVVNMWRPKGFVRSPSVSIAHFVGTEVVKLYFAAAWARLWPGPDSAQRVLARLAALNATDPTRTDDERERALRAFEDLTDRYRLTWRAPADARLAPACEADAHRDAFLAWVRGRTYAMRGPVTWMAALTSAVGCAMCALASLYFWLLKKPKKSMDFRSDPANMALNV
jgi:hypothetical protein